jgi:hypothetical protein
MRFEVDVSLWKYAFLYSVPNDFLNEVLYALFPFQDTAALGNG